MINSQKICPICDEGVLIKVQNKSEITYRSHVVLVDGFWHSKCQTCGASITNSEQARNNKRIVIAYQKKIDGLLTGYEVKAIRKKFGLTQSKACQIFGGGPVAFSKYETDDVTQSEAMDKLLRLTEHFDGVLEYLANQAKVEVVSSNSFSLLKFVKSYSNPNASHFHPLAGAPIWGEMHEYKFNTTMNDRIYYHDTEPAAA